MRPGERMIPLCVVCRRLHRRRTGPLSCDAYPQGIPRPILDGRSDHRGPLPGDDGIRFEPAPEVPAFIVEMVLQGLPSAGSRGQAFDGPPPGVIR